MFKNGLFVFPDKSLYHVVVHNSYLQISFVSGKINNFCDGIYTIFYSQSSDKACIMNDYCIVYDTALKPIETVSDDFYTPYIATDGKTKVGNVYLCRNNNDTVQITFVPYSKEVLYSQFVVNAEDFLNSNYKIPFTSYYIEFERR